MRSLLVTALTTLVAFGVMVGMSVPSSAVEGFATQPADLLSIASERDAVSDNEAGGQAGGDSSDLARNKPRLGKTPAGIGSEVDHPADIPNTTSLGEPVAAPASGRVVFAAPFKGYGPLLIIAHDKYHTVFWGFAQLEVMVDDFVAEGQTIGLIGGKSGSALILHVECRRNGHPIDLHEQLPGGPIRC
jgi:murein DD-endopeptidase MepM/ murein hydrolase activator NlpD